MDFSSQTARVNFPHIEVSLDNVLHNLNQIRSVLPSPLQIMAVVKDNAYGCGGVMVSRVLEAHGVGYFAVSRACEARLLREGGLRSPILVLGPACADDVRWGAKADIRFSLNDLDEVAVWKGLNATVRFHVNIDTGMGRMGLLPHEVVALARVLPDCPKLIFEGVFTHCANATDPDSSAAIGRQTASFKKALDLLNAHGLCGYHVHYANSAAAMLHPLEQCTMIRPGIALYGCKPDPASSTPLDLRPVLTLKAAVVKIKKVASGTAISYGSTYRTKTATTIATIGLGYGQGLPRQLSNKGMVLMRGRRYTIAGRVTMDYIMVDAGAQSDIAVGDEVVAIGSQGSEIISPDDIALACNTISYEILCSINSRIDRYYILNNTITRHEPCRPF